MWSGNSLSLIDTLEIGERTCYLALSPDLLAIGCYSGLNLYDLKTLAVVASLPCASPFSLSFSPDYARLAAGAYNVLQLWDLPRLKASFPSPKEQKSARVAALAFSQDCSRLAAGLWDGAVMLWNTCHPCHPIANGKGHSERIYV